MFYEAALQKQQAPFTCGQGDWFIESPKNFIIDIKKCHYARPGLVVYRGTLLVFLRKHSTHVESPSTVVGSAF